MRVAISLIKLHIPLATSLKAKRQVIKSLVQKLRNRFNVSVAEVGDQDLWQRAELALALVCQNGVGADKMLESIYSFLEREHRVQVISFDVERY